MLSLRSAWLGLGPVVRVRVRVRVKVSYYLGSACCTALSKSCSFSAEKKLSIFSGSVPLVSLRTCPLERLCSPNHSM